MSSEIYELMKRSDEAAVVEKAHRRPRFVEDCVREMIGGFVAAFPHLGDDRSCQPARRTSSRSTSTTSWRSASGCSASCGTSSQAASPPRITSRCASGSTGRGLRGANSLRSR